MRFYFYYIFLATRNVIKGIYLFTKMGYSLGRSMGERGLGRVGWGGVAP